MRFSLLSLSSPPRRCNMLPSSILFLVMLQHNSLLQSYILLLRGEQVETEQQWFIGSVGGLDVALHLMASGGRHLVVACSYDGNQGVTSNKILLKTSSRGRFIYIQISNAAYLYLGKEKVTLYIKSQWVMDKCESGFSCVCFLICFNIILIVRLCLVLV